MTKPLVSTSFSVPFIHSTEDFYFTTLDENVAELDYEAVMSSQQSLQGIFGPHSNWPEQDMTLEQNIISLNVHKQEFEARKAFAYSVFNLSQTKWLGPVDLSRLFLQRIVGHLCKAETLWCSYST